MVAANLGNNIFAHYFLGETSVSWSIKPDLRAPLQFSSAQIAGFVCDVGVTFPIGANVCAPYWWPINCQRWFHAYRRKCKPISIASISGLITLARRLFWLSFDVIVIDDYIVRSEIRQRYPRYRLFRFASAGTGFSLTSDMELCFQQLHHKLFSSVVYCISFGADDNAVTWRL
jgi:hypothetical protein